MDLDYFRSNINSVNGIKNFTDISNTNILILDKDTNSNIYEIYKNMNYLNIKNIFINKINIDFNNLEFVICDEKNKDIIESNNNNIKYFKLPNTNNLFIIGLVIQSIIDNTKYDIKKYLNMDINSNNKNILICGLGLISEKLTNNLNNNIYLYDNNKIDKYDLCNQNIFQYDQLNTNKIDSYKLYYKNKNNIHIFENIDDYNKWENIDIVINTIENNKFRKKINNICVQLNKSCYDVGIEKSMGHIISVIPFKTNIIKENEYKCKFEFPECKIENPEIIEHCIEKIKRNYTDNNIVFSKSNELATKLNIQNINRYNFDNYILDRIPKLNSIAYIISGYIIDSINYNNYDNIFINLEKNIKIEYIDDKLHLIKNEEYNQLYLSKIIVKKEYTEWDYLNINESKLHKLIEYLEKEYNGNVFTIIMNNNLLYYLNNIKNIDIKELCIKKNISIFNKNILNIILTNKNNDTILIPKIYLYYPQK